MDGWLRVGEVYFQNVVSGRSGRGGLHSLKYFSKAMLDEMVTGKK